MLIDTLKIKLKKPVNDTNNRSLANYIHIDFILFSLLLLLSTAGIFIIYSASNQSMLALQSRLFHLGIGFTVMFLFAQLPPISLQRSAIWLYLLGLILLIFVLMIGHIGKGGQRWLNIGIMRFQPAEIMKLAIPIVLAWYYHKIHLPIVFKSLLISVPIIIIPVVLTAKQPDLSTAFLLTIAGASVLFLAGLSWKFITSAFLMIASCIPFVWYVLYDYQKQRVLTFLNPERDPLGAGYHIIQSKIAIGSGGLFGKGWLNGTQANLHFLPEHSTDFIFAVCGEEFGFVGSLLIIILYVLIVMRCLYITINAQDTFSRLLAGSLTFTFFVSFFINMGMVTGVLPVMGIPLPFISHGGSSLVTLMASFGILMSIQTHRKLVTT